MNALPIRYATLRQQRHWDDTVVLRALQQRPDGALQLTGLPGVLSGDAIRIAAPFECPLSGIAIRKDGACLSSDTEADGRIALSICDGEKSDWIYGPAGSSLENGFNDPRGLLILGDQLLIADSGNGRVLALALDSYRLLNEWTLGIEEPVSLAADSAGRVYVLDAIQRVIRRFALDGTPDAPFNATLSAQTNVITPYALAVGANDVLYVTDATTNTVHRFDARGAALSDLARPEPSMFKPRAVIAMGERLYVADAESGFIFAFDSDRNVWLDRLEAYRGPVSAMALDRDGALLVKPSSGPPFFRLENSAGCVRNGNLVCGPIDAGIEDAWERVWIESEAAAQTTIALEIAVSSGSALPPEEQWMASPSPDVLLRTLTGIGIAAPRHVWLRVTLTSENGRHSPTLLQVNAATAEQSYLDHLPAIFRRDDVGGFLENWLALFRSELGEFERWMDELPRQFDARTADESELGKLGGWIALDLPSRLSKLQQRKLLTDAHAMYRRRGTPQGLREMAERYVGASVHVFEAFRERHIWQLNGTSRLGLDTALPAATPDGLVIPGFTFSDRRLSGLRGDYYSGTHFEILRHTRIDRTIEFDWLSSGPLDGIVPDDKFGNEYFSVRWSGQVRPRYSETYTFRTRSDDGVRLRVNDRLLIDDWNLHAPSDNSAQIRLEANKWYPIVIEYFEQTGRAQMELRWSSASQRSEIVPQECLYPLVDESAEIEPESHGGCELLEVGQAVVGQSRPQAADDFGAPLADDLAHLFSVVVAAAQIPLAAQRTALRKLIDAEKPAHTDYQLCLVEPQLRVGVQARLGIDSIVAGSGPAMRLGGVQLGGNSYLGSSTGRSIEAEAPG